MISNIDDFDFIVTRSEKEALVLEINLIKKYRPKYNIQFIDDSSYPYIKLTKEKYPRLLIARDTKKDKNAKYFGPFPDATAARTTFKTITVTLSHFRRMYSPLGNPKRYVCIITCINVSDLASLILIRKSMMK